MKLHNHKDIGALEIIFTANLISALNIRMLTKSKQGGSEVTKYYRKPSQLKANFRSLMFVQQ